MLRDRRGRCRLLSNAEGLKNVEQPISAPHDSPPMFVRPPFPARWSPARLADGAAPSASRWATRTSARAGEMEQRLRARFLPRGVAERPLPRARVGGLRLEPAACIFRSAAWATRPRGTGFLRSCRPVHEPDGGACRHRAAGRLLRAGGAALRLRDQCRGAILGAASPAHRAAAWRCPVRHRDHLRSRVQARTGRAFLERGGRGGVPYPARTERAEPGGPARRAGGAFA